MARTGILLIGCLVGGLSCVESPAGESLPLRSVQLGPWMMDAQPRQITVAWTTRLPEAGEVDVWLAEKPARTGARPLQIAREGVLRTDHRVTLTNLSPSTRYVFIIPADTPSHGSFVTAPDPAADPYAHPFKVLVYGDNRTNGGDHALVVNAAVAQHADLALHTGDMVVNAKDQHAWAQWFDVERELLANEPILPTVGNHEITNQGVTYSRHFKQPGGLPYHSVDYGDVHIQVLDSFEIQAGADPHAGAVSDAQKLWAEADAKTVPADHHLWMLVHQGPHTHPVEMRAGHGGLAGVRDLIAMVWKIHPVEAVFAGHEHFYERGELEGLRYFVIGGGGAPLEDPVEHGDGVALAVKALSFVTLEVCGCHVTGKTRDIAGHVFDSFTLSDCPKPCAAPLSDALDSVAVPNIGTQTNSPAAAPAAAPAR